MKIQPYSFYCYHVTFVLHKDKQSLYRILVGRPEGRRPLGRPRRRWENNIKMDLQEVGWEGVDWIDMARDMGQVAGSCDCGNEPSDSIKHGEFLD
jgi:hypothetical protein